MDYPLVRNKHTGHQGTSGRFNTVGISEVIVYYNYGLEPEFIADLDVLINGQWKDLGCAFDDHDLITDNLNTEFFFADNEEDRKRGYTLY